METLTDKLMAYRKKKPEAIQTDPEPVKEPEEVKEPVKKKTKKKKEGE